LIKKLETLKSDAAEMQIRLEKVDTDLQEIEEEE